MGIQAVHSFSGVGQAKEEEEGSTLSLAPDTNRGDGWRMVQEVRVPCQQAPSGGAEMSTNYHEWKERRQAIEHEIELLTKEAEFTHRKLMKAWHAGDPAFALNRRDREVNAKLEDALGRLEINNRAGPKESA